MPQPITRTVTIYPSPTNPQQVGPGDTLHRLIGVLQGIDKAAPRDASGTSTARIGALHILVTIDETLDARDFAALKAAELARAVTDIEDRIAKSLLGEVDAAASLRDALNRYNRTTWE